MKTDSSYYLSVGYVELTRYPQIMELIIET
jgi:hypothetical protein